MDWRNELRKAVRVQEVDRELDALRAERETLMRDPRELAAEKDLNARRVRLASHEEELAAIGRQQRLQELERQAQETERDRATRRLYAGEMKSVRDAEGLQRNIDGAARKIDELETAILEAMEQAQALGERLGQEREALVGAEAALGHRRKANRVRLGEVDAQLPLLDARREGEASNVDARVLREYERVRARCGGVGLAAAGGGACGACGFSLSTLLQGRVREGAAPVTCEHCGRLLVDA